MPGSVASGTHCMIYTEDGGDNRSLRIYFSLPTGLRCILLQKTQLRIHVRVNTTSRTVPKILFQ